MTHLEVTGETACGATDGACVGPEDVELVDCEACKTTVLFRMAERHLDAKCHDGWNDILRLVESHQDPIPGKLGDEAVVTPGMTKAEQLKAKLAAMPPENRTEWLRRIATMCADVCPGCGGSVTEDDHADDCPGADPDGWELTDEEVHASLRVYGYSEDDLDDLHARFRAIIAEYTDGG